MPSADALRSPARVLVAWVALTVAIVVQTLSWEWPLALSGWLGFYPYLLLVLLAIGGFVIARRAPSTIAVAAGVVLAVAAVSPIGWDCLLVACPDPSAAEPWRNVAARFQWGAFGPELAVTTDQVPCGWGCPTLIRLVPAAPAYVLVGLGVQTSWDPRSIVER